MNNAVYLWRSTLSLVRKEVVRVIKLWRQTIFPSFVTTVLYFAIFGFVLGSRVGDIDGIPYLHFVAPGLVMLAVTVNSYSSSAFSTFLEKFHRSMEELLSSPLNDHQIIWGFALGAVFRGMVCSLVVWLTTWAFVGYLMAHPFFFLGAMVLTCLVFALMGVINGLVARNFDDMNVVTVLMLNPLVMLGGVFYSVNMLTGFWQDLAWLNPLLYIGNLFRYAMVGASNVSPWLVMNILMGLIVLFYGIAYWLMRHTTYVRQ